MQKEQRGKEAKRRGIDNTVLCHSFCSGYLIPLLESAWQKGTVLSCTETIPPGPEMASDEIEDRKKTLHLSGRFETPQLLFTQSCEDCPVIYEEDR